MFICEMWLFDLFSSRTQNLIPDLNPFIPEFLKWTLLFLDLDLSTDANRGFSLKSKTEWQTTDSDETARYVSSGSKLFCNGTCFGLHG